MSQVYTHIIRPIVANICLLESFDLSVFQNLNCDEKSAMMHSNVSTLYLFTCLFNICLFD